MTEKKAFYCKEYIVPAGFRGEGGAFAEEPRPFVAMVDDRDAVLMCNRVEPHEHQWPDDYKPLNPKSRSA